MFKLFLFEATQKLALSIGGQPRQVFNKGDKIIVTEENKIRLLRLNFSLVGQKVLNYKNIEWDDITTPVTKKTSKVKAKTQTS